MAIARNDPKTSQTLSVPEANLELDNGTRSNCPGTRLLIRSLHIQNFMAYADATLELAEGVTVIVGANNTGKSALVEALYHLCHNPTPSHVIRHGCKRAKVSAELACGTTVRWERARKSARYVVTKACGSEEVYAKLGRGHVPADVRALLRMAPVEVEGHSFDIHFAEQRQPVFLLDRAGSQVAAFVAASTEAHHLLAMQQLLKDRVRAHELVRKRWRTEVDELGVRMTRWSDLPPFEDGVAKLRVEYERLRHEQGALASLSERRERLVHSALASARLQHANQVLESLQQPCTLTTTTHLAGLLSKLQRVAAHVQELRAQQALLSGLQPAPVGASTTPLAKVVGALVGSVAKIRALETTAQALAGLNEAPAVFAAAELAATLSALVHQHARLHQARRRAAALENLVPVPECEELGALAALGAALSKQADAVHRIEKSGQDLQVAIASARERLEAVVAQVGTCPLCTQPLTVANVLGELPAELEGCEHES